MLFVASLFRSPFFLSLQYFPPYPISISCPSCIPLCFCLHARLHTWHGLFTFVILTVVGPLSFTMLANSSHKSYKYLLNSTRHPQMRWSEARIYSRIMFGLSVKLKHITYMMFKKLAYSPAIGAEERLRVAHRDE